MFTNWRFWLGIGFSLLLCLILFYQVDWDEITAALAQANYFYVAPAIGLYFIQVYLRVLRWRYLLSPIRVVRIGRLYPVVIIGYMANNLLPARLGEVVRSYFLARREGFNTSTALATVLVERLYDGLTLLAFAALAGPVLLWLNQFGGASPISRTTAAALGGLTAGLFLGLLLFLTLLATVPRFLVLVQWGLGLVPARLRPKAKELTLTFVEGLNVLKSPRRHLGLLLLSVPVWLLEGSMHLLVAYSFGIDDYFSSVWILLLVIGLVTAAANLATSVPTAMGGLGAFEVAAQQSLLALGVGASVATTYIGFLHLVVLWLPANLAGLVLLWKQNLSFGELTRVGHRPVERVAEAPVLPASKGKVSATTTGGAGRLKAEWIEGSDCR